MRIRFYKELPQYIISSDIAAYHPNSKTIFIRKGLGLKLPGVLLHELAHWFIHVCKLPETLHRKLDKR